MAKNLPPISKKYKKEVLNSAFLVLVFFLIYTLLIALSLALIVVLGYFSFQIITFKLSYWTAILSAGIFSVGIFIFIFLVKFIFSSFKNDESSLIEINRIHEPDLFKLIDEVVENVGTARPKKVFLSPEVNAFVNYNSTFWSMFLPVKKNLTIGLGLINTTSVIELKGILAHEFGHFSQRSMKIGSYVNQANKMIHSTLYDNEGFDSTLNTFASTNAIIFFFAKISYLIISGIKWILQKTYEFLYKKHLSLSRQMEFHADAIAATVVGSAAYNSALLRIDLSDMALNNSIAVYKNSTETINTKNIFENQTSLLHFYAKEFNHEIINELPQINLMDLKKFDQSKLMIENQWSSHPTIQQRTDFIQKMNIRTENKNTVLAINILHNFEKYSQVLSQKLLTLNGINYNELFISNEIFMENFEEKETEYKFPTIFNSYYNIKNPLLQNLNFVNSNGKDLQPENFFSNENVGFVFEKNSLENDLQTLELIRTKEIKLKTFDYDGRKYSANESHKVKVIAEKRLEELTLKIEKNDQEILSFLAQNSDGEIKIILQEKIEKYIEADKNFEKYNQKFIEFVSYTSFMSVQLPFEEIRKKRFILLEREKVFKEMLKECSFKMSSTEEEKAIFQKYISAENKYF
jgi:Zn-dependent protease with chaperone function